MISSPFFHIGVVVADIHRARAEFAKRYAIKFTDVAAVDYDVVLPDGTSYFRRSHVAFSRNGEPYYELLQVGDDELFGAGELGRVHHVGVWTPNAVRSRDEHVAGGGVVAAEIRNAGGPTRAWYTDPAQTYGIRWEFQEESRRAWLDEFIRTGIAP
jgi:hypothetical protein